ncbi:MAG: FtsL-like putative cell division protein [Prevotella sp.]
MNDDKPYEIILDAEPSPQTPGPSEPPTAATTAPDAPPQPESGPQQQEQTFREALREQIHEDEPSGQMSSYIDLLCGSFFTSQILRRQIWLILLITLFVIVYISNRYSCQKSLIEIDQLKMELQDAKYKALSTSSRLTERSRQSRVLDMLKENKDSVLHIADRPPFIVRVPEGE